LSFGFFHAWRSHLSCLLAIRYVQKWKAFSKETEAMTKALKKKDTAGALKAYQDSTVALDEYLSQVDLPPSKEISSS
jgi:hypothetical protein